MADHHTRHNPLGQDALFTTPASLMLDARLTPLERNGWQVLRMLRSADGISPLANLGQLRRYLTSTPLGQRAGYETARRVLVVLRLTGWISLVGQQRDPLTGHVLSELYQVHESALDFQQACTLDASLPALLQSSVGHENNQVDRVAIHIQATLAQAPEATSIAPHDQHHSDDDLPPTPPPQVHQAAGQLSSSRDSAGSTLVPQQTGLARHMTAEQGSTYKTYMYKKERTYRAREGDGDSASQSVSLPPCLSNAQADQQKDVQAALRRLPPQQRQ
ncbi:STY4528 family pathogenicity island replication protein, partial [Pseudomonas aeruginosa]